MNENLVLRLLDDLRAAAPELGRRARPHRRALALAGLGAVVAVGSTGLLLGALTTALASLVMRAGVPMVPAMNVGFFTVGGLALAAGLFLTWKGASPLLRGLADDSGPGREGR